MRIISNLLKTKLAENGLKQKEFSLKIGVSENTIRQWIFKESIPDKYIPKLKETFGNEYTQFVINENTSNGIEDNQELIPYFDIDVTAGSLTMFEDESAEFAAGHIKIPGLVADFVVPVHGHSMHPEVSSGDWIAVRRLHDLDWINFGHKYLIVTEEQRMVKIIKSNPDKATINLVSCNSEFDVIELPKHKIKQLFMVVQVLKRETM